jgi:hypothetical protein
MTSIIKVDQIQTASGSAPTAADLGINVAGNVLQTAVANISNQVNTNNQSDTEVSSALRVTLTPRSATSKFVVFLCYHVVTVSGASHATVFPLRMINGSWQNVSNYSTGSKNEAHRNAFSTGEFITATQVILDEPATTSAVTYSLFMRTNGSNIRINDNGCDTRIVVQEIAG